MERNTVILNRGTGNAQCDILTARLSLRSKGDLQVAGKANLGEVCVKSIAADSVVLSGYTFKQNQVTHLCQTDFASGTYRIRTPGLYRLTENIVFNPDPLKEAGRTDKPLIGAWFCVLSIECADVVLDGQGYTIQVSEDFILGHHIKVFSCVELSNAPFPGIPFPMNTITFQGDADFTPAERVHIVNLRTGLSSHHGIHGTGNSDVTICGFEISDHEVAGITLNACRDVLIADGTISGTRHEIINRSRPAQLTTLRNMLVHYRDTVGVPSAAAHVDAVNAALTAELASRTQGPIESPDGNTYGISIAPAPAAGGPRFDQAGCDGAPHISGTSRLPSNVEIRGVKINNVRGAPNQQVSLVGAVRVSPYGSNPAPSPTDQQLVGNHAGAFGALLWEDFYAGGGGAWGPNDVAKAQTFLLQQRRIELAIDEADSYFLPTGFEANILGGSPDETTFKSHVKPGFTFDIAHFNKGVMGLKMGCVRGLKIHECCVANIENSAPPSLLRSDISAGGDFTDADAGLNSRYIGTDAYGISLENCESAQVSCCAVDQIHSQNGNSHNIVVSGQCRGVEISNTIGQVTWTDADPATPDVPNPSGTSYGGLTQDSTATKWTNSQMKLVHAPRCAFAFANQNSLGTNYHLCLGQATQVTAGHDAARPKKAAGYTTTGSKQTVIDGCDASNNAVRGESPGASPNTSRLHGFDIQDERCTLEKSTSYQNDGGAGTAWGAEISGDNCYTNELKTIGNFSSQAGGAGYGFVDSGTGNIAGSGNVSAANQTAN